MAAPEVHSLSESRQTVISGKDFGTFGSYVLEEIPFTFKDELNELTVPVHLLKRSDNLTAFGPVKETASGPRQLTLMSGFATEGTEWMRMAVTLMHEIPELSQITILDHPSSAPSAVHTHMDAPFNTDSFRRSGNVIASLLGELTRTGKLSGKQTAVALSTGCPVILEANADNPDLFQKIVLIAPGGMQDRTVPEMEKGAGSGSSEYLKRFFTDIGSEWRFRYRQSLAGADGGLPSPFGKLLAAVKATGKFISEGKADTETDPVDDRTNPIVFIGDLKHTYPKHPLWQQMSRADKQGHILFEVAAGLIGRRTSFWPHFTGMWGDSRPGPHMPVRTRQYMDDLKLVSKDCTGTARACVTGNQELTVILGANDRAVPPEGFLTDTDRMAIADADGADAKVNETVVRISERVRQKFPNARKTNVILTSCGSPSGHVELKTETELYGFLIARQISDEQPAESYVPS